MGWRDGGIVHSNLGLHDQTARTCLCFQDLCIAVTTVLHYLFLSSFCWMLCEGIMLYLLLVVVFSKLSKNVWFFLLIGYGE